MAQTKKCVWNVVDGAFLVSHYKLLQIESKKSVN